MCSNVSNLVSPSAVDAFLALRKPGHHPACWVRDISGDCEVEPIADTPETWAEIRRHSNLMYNGHALSYASHEYNWISWEPDYTPDAAVADMVALVVAQKSDAMPFLNHWVDGHYDEFFRVGGEPRSIGGHGGENDLINLCRGHEHHVSDGVMTYARSDGHPCRLYVSPFDRHVPSCPKAAELVAAANEREASEFSVTGCAVKHVDGSISFEAEPGQSMEWLADAVFVDKYGKRMPLLEAIF